MTKKIIHNTVNDVNIIQKIKIICVIYTKMAMAMAYITGSGSFIGNFTIMVGPGSTPYPTFSSFVISNQVIGVTSTLSLNVTSNSTASIKYSSSNKNVAKVNGNTLTIVGVGTVTITASQLANTNPNGISYLAGSTSTTFQVTAVPTTLSDNLSLVFSPTTSSASGYSISGNAGTATVDGNQVFSLSGNGSITVYLGNP
jgi:hypothetical protein